MKLRSLRRWPALFVAFFALVAGPVAQGAEDRSGPSMSSTGQAASATAEVAARIVLEEVSALCEAAAAGGRRSLPGARACRTLADRIDAVVARTLGECPMASMAEQRALAAILATADDLRSMDNRVRKTALMRMSVTGAV